MADSYGDPNRTGSGFVNLQQYLDANKDNDLEKTVAGGVTAESKKAQDDLNTADQKFNQDANSSRSDVDASGNDTLSSLNDTLKRAETDPSKLSDDDVRQFQGTAGKTYTAPVGSQVGQKELNEAQTAEAAGQSVNSEGGRYGLLQRYLGGNGGYTMGQQGLDNALLSNSNGNQLRQAQRGTVGLSGQVNRVGQNEQNTNNLYAANDQNFHKGVNTALYGDGGSSANLQGGAIGGIVNGADAAAKQYRTDNDTNYRNILAGFSNGGNFGSVDPNVVRQVGLGNVNATGAAQRVPVANYLHQVDPTAINRNTVMTPAQYAQLQALSRLAGNTNTYVTNPAQVGTYDPSRAIQFDQTGYIHATDAAAPQFGQDSAAAIGAINRENWWNRV